MLRVRGVSRRQTFAPIGYIRTTWLAWSLRDNPHLGNTVDIATFAGHLHIVSVIEPNIIAAGSEPVIANRAKRAAILGAGGPMSVGPRQAFYEREIF